MVCCNFMETLVCFALLNGLLPVCDLHVCKLGPGGCECFILKRVLYEWFLSLLHRDYMVALTVMLTSNFPRSFAHMFAVITFAFGFVSATGR